MSNIYGSVIALFTLFGQNRPEQTVFCYKREGNRKFYLFNYRPIRIVSKLHHSVAMYLCYLPCVVGSDRQQAR